MRSSGRGGADAQDFEAVEQALRRQAPRNRRAGNGAAIQRGRFRPFGFDQSVRLRPDGALRRPPPEDLHHAARAADAGTGLLPLRRLPYGGVSARPDPGYASHLAVTGHHAHGGFDGGRGQLRRDERVVGGPGRGRSRDPAGRALCRAARPPSRRRRARRHRADRTGARAHAVPRDGRHGHAGAPGRGRRASREAARRLGQDSRGQAGHRVDGRRARPARPACPRPRVGQLQRRGRERGQPRHRPAAGRLRTTCLSRGATARLRPG